VILHLRGRLRNVKKLGPESSLIQIVGRISDPPLEDRLRNGNGGNDLLLAVVRIGTVVVVLTKLRDIRRAAGRIAEVVAMKVFNT